MRQIIDGKRYDTETAALIGETSSEHSRTDFEWWQAGLYVTRKGAFFLAGRGGPSSMFAHHLKIGRTGGERIIPMDRSEALAWASEQLPVSIVESVFQDTIEDA